MANRVGLQIWNKTINHKKNSKELQLRLLLTQLKTDIDYLLEQYNEVAKEYFNVEIYVDSKISLKENKYE